MAAGDLDFLHQAFHHVRNQQEQVNKLMAGRDFALAHIVEQRFGFMGQGIELIVADNAAVALHVVEKTEEIVDQIVPAGGVFFQFQQPVIQARDNFIGFVDEILEMAFAKSGKRVGLATGQSGDPFLGAQTRAVIVFSRASCRLCRCLGFRHRFESFGGKRSVSHRRRGLLRRGGFRLGRAVAGHNGFDLRHDVLDFHIAFGIGDFEIVDHLAQGVRGGQDYIHDLRGHHHAAFAQFIQDIFGFVSQLVDTVQAQKAGSSLERVHGPENIVEQGQVVRSFFKLQQIRLDGFEVFLGFSDKIREKFRIKKFLAHTHTFVWLKEQKCSRWGTYCFSYRLAKKHLYVPDHFFRLGGFNHVQVGSQAHAGLDVLFLAFGGKHDDGDILIGVLRANGLDEGETVHTRHIDV